MKKSALFSVLLGTLIVAGTLFWGSSGLAGANSSFSPFQRPDGPGQVRYYLADYNPNLRYSFVKTSLNSGDTLTLTWQNANNLKLSVFDYATSQPVVDQNSTPISVTCATQTDCTAQNHTLRLTMPVAVPNAVVVVKGLDQHFTSVSWTLNGPHSMRLMPAMMIFMPYPKFTDNGDGTTTVQFKTFASSQANMTDARAEYYVYENGTKLNTLLATHDFGKLEPGTLTDSSFVMPSSTAGVSFMAHADSYGETFTARYNFFNTNLPRL